MRSLSLEAFQQPLAELAHNLDQPRPDDPLIARDQPGWHLTKRAISTGALATPLPSSLGGVSLEIGNYPLSGLFYAGANQINAQLSWGLSNRPDLSFTAVTGFGMSTPTPFTVAEFSPGLFSINGQGTGQGAILGFNYQVVDSTHPARAGDVIQIYCTGLGEVTNTPADGAPALAEPLSLTMTTPTVTIGGVTAQTQFSGLTPGTVGLYQINAQVPSGITSGSAVPVTVSISTATSNTVTIAVQ